jgi:hypothetical protein
METHNKSGFWPTSVIFCAFFTFAASGFAGTYSGGSGTVDDPYKISTVADWGELIATSADWDKNFILLNDIDFGGANLTLVAPNPEDYIDLAGTPFIGQFNGNGHVLRNAVLDFQEHFYHSVVGLFGCLGNGSRIENLGLENIKVGAFRNAGTLCGLNDGGTISNCFATGSLGNVVILSSYVGGLCGENRGEIIGCYATVSAGNRGEGGCSGGLCGVNWGTISRCYATGDVGTMYGNDGGLCGNNLGTIIDCYATGKVGRSCGWNVGGLCGSNDGLIRDCFATGVVTANDSVGGLCGENETGTIVHCYATGQVEGYSNLGGLCGRIEPYEDTPGLSGMTGTISGCFWDIETSGQSRGVGKGTSDGVTGKTTAEMKTAATFTDAAWDFVGETANGTEDIWRMCADGVDYPRLSWEFSRGGDGGFVVSGGAVDGKYAGDGRGGGWEWGREGRYGRSGDCQRKLDKTVR